jgi:hypothetical protein
MTDQNTNLAIWNAVETTDPSYTKSFSKGGGFKGTSTNATYLAKKATNQFGPIGIGWGWTVLEENFAQGQDKDIIHILKIKLWYIWGDKRGEIEHFGQTQFVGKNKNGYYTDEEAPKKSLTDAISKSLSLLGFAADIHLGMYDDNRYVNDLKRDFKGTDEFGGANDNAEDSNVAKDQGGLTAEEAGKIVQFWEDELAKCKKVTEVMELVGCDDFKADLKKLHPDDEKFLREAASARSQELKRNGTKKDPKEDAA